MPAAVGATEVQVVRMTINGSDVEARAGQTVLEAAREAGIDIPTLCHDPRLEPYGACRLCLVEVEGARGPMASCGTKVSEGMKVETETEKIVKLRKFVLELLLTNHPLDCPVCEAAGDCKLQDYAYEYLVDMVPWGWRAPEASDPGSHPNVAHFGSRCILCGRCVRICREVMSIGCWGYLNRGYESEVDTPYRRPLAEVGCVSCGQCVSTCPVGAVTTQRVPLGARQWQTEKTRTTCSYCSNGCELVVHTYQDRVVRVTSDSESPLNKGNLCVKGRFGQGYADSAERLLAPLVRDAGGELRQATWDEAVGRVVEEFSLLKAEGAGQGVAVVCGTHCTNEAAFLARKLAREVMGSKKVVASDGAMKSVVAGVLGAAFPQGLPNNDRVALEKADAILVVGSNLTEANPVLALAVIKAVRKGKTVIVIGPRRTELARRATIHLAPRVGADGDLLKGMLAHILSQGLQEDETGFEKTQGLEALKASLASVNVDAMASSAGVDPDDLRKAAEALASAGSTAVMFGPAACVRPDAGAVVSALVDLALLTGAVGLSGGGLYPLVVGANSQGLSDMGLSAAGAEAAAPTLEEVLADVETGTLKALYVVGEDLVASVPDEQRTLSELQKVPFLVVQDSFLTATAKAADVVLPAAVPVEDDGTYTNVEGMVQRVRPAKAPKAASLPDWTILAKVGGALGAGWDYSTAAEVMDEIASSVGSYAGVSHARIDSAGPVSTGSEEGPAEARLLPVGAETTGGDDLEGLRLTTGSVLQHHEGGTRSLRAEGLTKLIGAATVEINPADAAVAGVADGDRVRVSAPAGAAIELPAAVTERVPQGVVFIPGFDPEAPVTRLQVRPAGTPVAVSIQPA